MSQQQIPHLIHRAAVRPAEAFLGKTPSPPPPTPPPSPEDESGCFSRFFHSWKSSLLKLCYKELILFLIIFNAISLLYRLVLLNRPDDRKIFEKFASFFAKYMTMISLPFLLGFYLTIIAQRWWNQYLAIPWPDRVMMTVSMYVGGAQDNRSRLLRRVLMRRCLLMLVLLFRHISEAVLERFPTIDHLVQYGVMSQSEKKHYESIQADISLFWVPGAWFVSALQDAVAEGLVKDSEGIKLIMEGFLEFRSKCGLLWSYNWQSIPKVYGQVVTLAVYSYFSACLVGRQCIEPAADSSLVITCHVEAYLPVWTCFEFLFYMGLLKVAEQMENPFGNDEEDFDLNFLIDRHLKALRLDVDYLSGTYPPVNDDATASLSGNVPSQPSKTQLPVKVKVTPTAIVTLATKY